MPKIRLSPQAIAEAAASIVDTQGTTALTLARLATHFGVAAPSLYKHVNGIDDLVVRVATLAAQRLADALTEAAVGQSGHDALSSIATTYRCFANEHPGLYSLTQTALKTDSAAHRAQALRAVAIFGAVTKSYGVPEELAVHAMRIVRAALHGFVDIETRRGFRMPHSIDASFMLLIETLHSSLHHFCARGNERGV